MKFIKPLVVAGAFVAAGNVHAYMVEFRFTGTVTSGPLAPVGSQVVGYFSYDTDTVPWVGGADEGVAMYDVPAPARIEATVDGHVVSAQGTRVSVFNDMAGTTQDILDVGQSAPLVDGEVLTDGSFGLRLFSFDGGLDSAALPTQIDLAAFESHPSMTYGFVNSDGGQQGERLSFTIDSITAVPVPASVWLFGSGLLGLAAATRRRTLCAQKQND